MTINNLEKLCIPKSAPPPPQHTPLTPAKSKVFSRRKSHQTTAIIFSRPRGDRGATTEEGKLLQIFFLIATGREIATNTGTNFRDDHAKRHIFQKENLSLANAIFHRGTAP